MTIFYKSFFLRLIFVSLISYTSLQAGLINAISVVVNNDIITLVDIDDKIKEKQISKTNAIKVLIDEILYKQALKKENIGVDDFDIDNYIELLAKQNNMKIHEFKNAVIQQESYTSFRSKIKKQIIHQKLLQSISASNLKKVSDDDMKIYYNNNIEQFIKPLKTDVKVYSSLKKSDLIDVKNNPMSINNINVEDLTLENTKINAKIKYILAHTKEKSFSTIFKNKKIYNMFFILKKYDVKTIKFDDVKSKIFQIMMKERENEFLKNYFETLKITADIKVIR